MAARAIESDLDFAFHLQLEEAINASLSLQRSTSSSSTTPKPKLPVPDAPNDDVLNLAGMQTLELEKFEQELDHQALIEAEMKKMREDLNRRIHDQKVAREIESMPDDEWEEQGEYFERPFGEGSSKNVAAEVFRVYFKGLVNEELVGNSSSNATVAGVGVAICDSRDQVIFELKKPLIGSEMSRRAVEFKALIEGLNAAIALDLKKIVYYCDYYPLYQFVTGRWHLPKQRRIANLVNQVSRLSVNKFTYCRPTLVARNDIKFAFKFAREAIVSQINKPSSSSLSSSNQTKNENCVICFEDTDVTHFFSVDVCNHRYCFSCMRQHVEMKLRIGMVPKCPHEGCNSQLKIDSCKKFLTPKLIELMGQRLKEASIPPTEKIYCPYPKCSALMTKSEVLEHSQTAYAVAWKLGVRKCLKCQGSFCINCKVPWHNGMNCSEHKRTNPGDAKLKTLAERNLWRQCVKCNHMIEFVAGCYHMTCRCGYEFCYTCGAEWKNKKATCACLLWDEQHILDGNEDDEGGEENLEQRILDGNEDDENLEQHILDGNEDDEDGEENLFADYDDEEENLFDELFADYDDEEENLFEELFADYDDEEENLFEENLFADYDDDEEEHLFEEKLFADYDDEEENLFEEKLFADYDDEEENLFEEKLFADYDDGEFE